jgi:hypothetical protein
MQRAVVIAAFGERSERRGSHDHHGDEKGRPDKVLSFHGMKKKKNLLPDFSTERPTGKAPRPACSSVWLLSLVDALNNIRFFQEGGKGKPPFSKNTGGFRF